MLELSVKVAKVAQGFEMLYCQIQSHKGVHRKITRSEELEDAI